MDKNNKLAVIILGSPGSGKGTQARLTAKEFKLVYFGVSEMIRKKFKSNPNLSEVKRAKKRYYAGKLIPSSTIIKWVIEKINKGLPKRIVFDGLLRSFNEAKRLFPKLEKYYGTGNITVLSIKLGKQESIHRNLKRRICSKCGRSIPYNKKTRLWKKCPYKGCGGKIIRRALDTRDLVGKRYDVYKKNINPVLKYFKKRGLLSQINGRQEIRDVFKDIKNILNDSENKRRVK